MANSYYWELPPPQPFADRLRQQMQAQSNQANQQANQQAYQNAVAAGAQWPPVSGGTIPRTPVTVVASMSPLTEIARRKINQLIDQLPLKIISRIHLIELQDLGLNTYKFVVTYTDFRTQDFCNVDEFPSPADVSLVLLGTP